MPFIHTTDTTTHHTHGAHFTPYTAPSLGSTTLCVWQLTVPPHTTGQPHTISHEETLVITTGTLTITLDHHTADLHTGDAAHAPAHTTINVATTTDHPATAIVATTTGLQATLPDGTTITPPWTR
jgi:quercetin dioxygenase-like cupin family protein